MDDTAANDIGGQAFSAPPTNDVVSSSAEAVDLLVSECYKAIQAGGQAGPS